MCQTSPDVRVARHGALGQQTHDRQAIRGNRQRGPRRKGEGGSPTPQGPGGSRLPRRSVSGPPPPPPATAESVIGFGLARQWAAHINDGDRTRTDVPIWRAWRLSSADVLCAVRCAEARRRSAVLGAYDEAAPRPKAASLYPRSGADRSPHWPRSDSPCEADLQLEVRLRKLRAVVVHRDHATGMVGVADGVPDRRVRRRRPGSTSEPLPQRPGRGRGVKRGFAAQRRARWAGRCPSERAPVCGDVGC